MEANMIATEPVRGRVDDAFLTSELPWLDRELPEDEWDASETALLVEDVVGRSRLIAGH
jgi:hypothetical protein